MTVDPPNSQAPSTTGVQSPLAERALASALSLLTELVDRYAVELRACSLPPDATPQQVARLEEKRNNARRACALIHRIVSGSTPRPGSRSTRNHSDGSPGNPPADETNLFTSMQPAPASPDLPYQASPPVGPPTPPPLHDSPVPPQALTAALGRPPTAIAFAPGRVNLIGDHTDYSEGFVMPAALDLGCFTALAQSDQPEHRLIALDFAEECRIPVGASPTQLAQSPRWARYIAGVLDRWYAHHHHAGIAQQPLVIAVHSTVPPGGGLSSSAALEVSVATALDALHAVTTDPRAKARLCRDAENLFAGVPCGIMDQLISCLGVEGHALVIDCRSLEATPVALPPPELASFVLFDSGVAHSNDNPAYAQRRADCERAARTLKVPTLRDAKYSAFQHIYTRFDDAARRACLHVFFENSRVSEFAQALSAGDVIEAGKCMNFSHRSLHDFYRVSHPAVEALVDRLLQHDAVLGCRMTGAGFGGWVLALIRAGAEITLDGVRSMPVITGGAARALRVPVA